MRPKTLPPHLIREDDGAKFVLNTMFGDYSLSDSAGTSRTMMTWSYDSLMKTGAFVTPEEFNVIHTRKECPAFSVTIFMAGDLATAKTVCQEECDREGLCVTVEPTTYIYTGGSEEGFRVGLINYARFPSRHNEILLRARRLARLLLERCGQTSFSIVTPDTSYYYSKKGKD